MVEHAPRSAKAEKVLDPQAVDQRDASDQDVVKLEQVEGSWIALVNSLLQATNCPSSFCTFLDDLRGATRTHDVWLQCKEKSFVILELQ
jgi:hypothetical protein